MTVDRMEGSTFTVLEGRDGWLFLDTSDDFEVLRLYTDPAYVRPDVINAWRVALGARREYFQSLIEQARDPLTCAHPIPSCLQTSSATGKMSAP